MYNKALNDIVAIQNAANPPVEGDYLGETGLWVCGKCHAPKQIVLQNPLTGEVSYPMILCDCAKKKRDEEERARKAYEYRENAFDNREMWKWTFGNDDGTDKKTTRAMQRYVNNFTSMLRAGRGLVLHGPTGTGKTYAACEVANALLDQLYPVKVTNFAAVLNDLQGTFEKREYIERFNRYALLIIDDLGIERNTEFAKEQVFNIIDSRYRAGLPMIITTNLSINNLSKPEDIENQRIYDRILERCFPIEVTEVNRRRKAIREGYDDMRELLGL